MATAIALYGRRIAITTPLERNLIPRIETIMLTVHFTADEAENKGILPRTRYTKQRINTNSKTLEINTVLALSVAVNEGVVSPTIKDKPGITALLKNFDNCSPSADIGSAVVVCALTKAIKNKDIITDAKIKPAFLFMFFLSIYPL